MKKKLIFIAIICSLLACQQSQKSAKTIVQEWQGKKIIKPFNIEYKILGRDTIFSDIWDKPYKILTYLDTVGCTSCQFKQYLWKKTIDSCMINQLNVGFLFVIHTSDFELFEYDLIASGFNYPVIYDRLNEFGKLNHFSSTPYNTFLLDKNNNVLLVGSPINNSKMWELYKKTINQLNIN
jgi:hypothetical protein